MDYTNRAAALCFATLVALVAISFIPPQNVFGVETRRANILSELTRFASDDVVAEVGTELEINEEEYHIDMEQVASALDSLRSEEPSAQSSFTWIDDAEQEIDTLAFEPVERAVEPQLAQLELKRRVPSAELVPIEDFDTTASSAFKRLYTKLLSPDSMVRVALLGDSFVEADILSADLREALQCQFGGMGAGFAPAASPLTAYRKTIKTEAKGWQSYNIMQRSKTPAPYNQYYAVSGWVSRPSAGATTKWSCTSVREHIDSCTRVRILFLARHHATIEVVINGLRTRSFDISASESLRQIELSDPAIKSVEMRIVEGHDGFVGYGAIFEGDNGVVVDNYSIRSNNGQAMLWTNPAINAQIDSSIGGYDLVLLQYGLNIMQKGVTKYSNYGAQIDKMIAYARSCFPSAAIIVMGVSDRSMRSEGEYKPMSEAPMLCEYQRAAAERSGVAFWNTYEAMQAQGGMSEFVRKGWAGKDYTHINFAGGRQVAWALYDAIVAGVGHHQTAMIKRRAEQNIIDSERDSLIRHELLNSIQQ